MKLKTSNFGEVEIDKEKIINFENGIPGFSYLRKFILIHDVEAEGQVMFYWLQSIDEPEIAFVMVDMLKVMPDYEPLVPEDEIEELGEYSPEDFGIYNIVAFPKDVKEATVNLKAPIVINAKLKKGKQIICENNDYSVKHPLFEKVN